MIYESRPFGCRTHFCAKAGGMYPRKHVADLIQRLEAIDLFYRPVYAVRFRWQQKEAVVEVNAVTGETQTGGTTFENYVGKLVDRDFLLDAGVEAANMFIPGVNLAKIIVSKGLKLNAKA
jgi:hypothetical protein